MAFTEPMPLPPPPNVARVDKDGRPTEAWVTYERQLMAWLRQFAAAS